MDSIQWFNSGYLELDLIGIQHWLLWNNALFWVFYFKLLTNYKIILNHHQPHLKKTSTILHSYITAHQRISQSCKNMSDLSLTVTLQGMLLLLSYSTDDEAKI